jgi:predicted alpha/beta-hydrolase family hydrolase
MDRPTAVFSTTAGDPEGPLRIILAHGAGAGITSPFIQSMTGDLVALGASVTGFEFAYMAARRSGGSKRPPPRAAALTQEYSSFVIAEGRRAKRSQRILIGGKSLGGRVASLVAEELHAAGLIDGLVCLGYPFHPPAKPDDLRTEHLVGIRTPTLIAQGERDPFGSKPEVEAMVLSANIRFHWVGDGDHDFGPRGKSPYARSANLRLASEAIMAFAAALPAPR